MSRSYKRPTTKLCCDSEKVWKKIWHQKYRKRLNDAVVTGDYENLPNKRKYGDPWDSPSDGKINWYISRFDLENPKDADYVKKRYVRIGKNWYLRK